MGASYLLTFRSTVFLTFEDKSETGNLKFGTQQETKNRKKKKFVSYAAKKRHLTAIDEKSF